MRIKFLFFGTMLLLLASLFIFTQSAVNAAPLAICISTAGGGDWANAGTWQFCTGSNPPASTDDVYIQGPVSMSAEQTAANVTISNGGSLNPGTNLFTANSMVIDSGGSFVGSLSLNGNLTDNGSFNGNGAAVTINGTTSVGSGATFTAGSGAVVLTGAVSDSGTLTAGGSTVFATDVTINGTGTLNCGSNPVDFRGNLTNNGTFNCTSGTAIFAGSALQNVGGSSALTFNNLTISNAAGVALNANASLTGVLNFTSGDLNTGSYILDLGSGAVVAGSSGGDVVGYVRRAGISGVGSYTFNSPYTLINFSSLTGGPTDITFGLDKSSPLGFTRALPRAYNITSSGSPTFNATLQLHYKSSEVTASFTEANLRPWRYDGALGKWVLQAGSQGGSGNNSYVQATNVTGFSKWAISDSGAPTAVTLSSIKATAPSFDLGAWFGNLFGR